MTQPRPTHRRNFSGHIFELTPLTVDFVLAGSGDIPVCPFLLGKKSPKTMYEQTVGEQSAAREPSQSEVDDALARYKAVLANGVVEMDGLPFDVEAVFARDPSEDPDLKSAIEAAFSAIVVMSFDRFNEPRKIDADAVLSIDFIARRYGKSPIEVLMPTGGYNDLDAYAFNMFVAGIGAKNEADQMKKASASKSPRPMRGGR